MSKAFQLSGKYKKAALLLGCFIAVFLLRSIHTFPAEVYDPFHKWYFSVNTVQLVDWSYTKENTEIHHFLRWGSNFPVMAAVSAFGFSFFTYFLMPLLFFTAFFVFYSRLALNRMAWPIAMLLCVILYVDPVLIRLSVQYHTGVFGVLYLLLAMEMASRRSKLHIFLAALLVFAAYGAKETYGLFFGPAFLIFIWMQYGKAAAFRFALYCLSFIAIETLIINAQFPDVTFGRAEILLNSDHANRVMQRYAGKYSVWGMISEPWRVYPTAYLLLAITAVAYGFYTLMSGKRRKAEDPLIVLCSMMVINFLLFFSLSFKSFSPPTPIQPPLIRYMTPVLPFAFFVAAYAVSKMLNIKNRKRVGLCIAAFSVALLGVFVARGHVFSINDTDEAYIYRTEWAGYMWKGDKLLKQYIEEMNQGNALIFEQDSSLNKSLKQRYRTKLAVFDYFLYNSKPMKAGELNLRRIRSKDRVVYLKWGVNAETLKQCRYLTEGDLPKYASLVLGELKTCPKDLDLKLKKR